MQGVFVKASIEIALTCCAACLVLYVSMAAAGSGIPEVNYTDDYETLMR